MTTITQELERTAHDIMTAPSFRDNVEIALAGGALAALLGYVKHRNRAEATRYAMWGAGIGVGAQYLVFHMLKPAMKQFARSSQGAAAMAGHHRGFVGAMGGGHHMPHFGFHHQAPCPPGMMFDPSVGQCVPPMGQ